MDIRTIRWRIVATLIVTTVLTTAAWRGVEHLIPTAPFPAVERHWVALATVATIFLGLSISAGLALLAMHPNKRYPDAKELAQNTACAFGCTVFISYAILMCAAQSAPRAALEGLVPSIALALSLILGALISYLVPGRSTSTTRKARRQARRQEDIYTW